MFHGVIDQLVTVNGAERNVAGKIGTLETIASRNGQRRMTLIFNEHGDLSEVRCRRSLWGLAFLVVMALGLFGAVLFVV